MSYVHEAGVLRRRRRRHRRTLLTLTSVSLLLGATLVYAVGNVPGFGQPAVPVAGACSPGRNASGALLPAPVSVRVNVYNATDRQGLAATVAAELRAQGFSVATVGNDPRHHTVRGRGEIRFGRAGALAAQTARTRMAGAKLVRDHRPDAIIDLVAGERFTHLRPPRTPSVTSGAAGAGGHASGC